MDANVRSRRFGLAPVGSAKKHQGGPSQRSGDVSGARIGAEDGLCTVEDRDQSADGKLTAKVDEPSRRFERKPRSFSHDDKPMFGHRIDQFLVVTPGPELCFPL